GQTAFFGVAAYTYGVIGINLSPITGETVTALIGGVVAAAALAAALGYFMFYGKVGDVYVAIITLAATLVLLQVMTSTAGPQYHIGKAQLGGYNGMTNIPSMEFGFPGHPGDQMSQPDTYTFVVVLAGIAFFVVRALLRSGFGRVITAIRENELRTELLGYDVRRAKVIVFAVGGAVAGLAGGAYAGWGNFMNPAPFSLPAAALIVIYVLVGGKGTLVGAFIGAVAVEWLSTALGGILPSSTTLVVGAVLIVVVLLVPGGLTPLIAGLVSRVAPRHTPVRRHAEIGGSVGGAGRGRELEARSLVKMFGGLKAVDSISLGFPAGQLHCLIGPNGAGKSTFFNLLVGRYRPTEGKILLEGRPITGLLPHQRAQRGIGIKLQVPSIYRELSVQENVWLAAFAKMSDKRQAEAAVDRVLARIGLVERATNRAGDLSHGEQQWLEIGMVIASSPDVILLDEPTAGMTHEETIRTVELVRGLAETATVVVVEHDMEFVQRLDAPVTVLHEGRILAQGPLSDIRRDQKVLDVYLGRTFRAAGS
ncbi:MAG: ATP-binding cassette domain-containing protein, partial [Candidatus Dormibacteraeota bacterium]|nr:ATP-binding cassette domain-containing protein [Candidatus Dormibacteraeota bacterium]